jgi:nucleoside-diphosphate-sugar epimerase
MKCKKEEMKIKYETKNSINSRSYWFYRTSFSIAKAKHELGYEPKIGLEEGIRRTIKWYEENEYV